MKRYILKLYLNIKTFWSYNTDDYEFAKELRRKTVKSIADELLQEPLSERLNMLKKINDIVLIQSHKQQKEFEYFVETQKENLKNFKV